ncbi:uncharacterized protein LOC131359729 [Hemibagrus wyckioides]|uniref:uncharacterized protein LOC131359729 n=1 Tax=Hemibagrus wyckioides TaxID=337641 RepID=UPI00266D1170|nr:uncharacterized protein LOC131359729 [Hemibagrus wyckioides]XP_058255791.1 uncharacterized protein LOC131359729 [Hemibagrus wyckioides]
MTQSSLCFVSWNTNGIKKTSMSPQKFSKLLSSFRNLHADVGFIQETHVGTEDDILKDVEGWRSYFTVYSSKSKGVAMLIRDSVPFEYICHDEDYSGGYIVLFCKLYGELFTLVNVYNHKADKKVLGRLKEYLMETAEGVLVVGGDFNTVLHPGFDRSHSKSQASHSPLRTFLEDFTVSLNLRDTWSYKHPAVDGFTRRQNDSHSRIDMFFLPEHKVGLVDNINVAYEEAKLQDISDHYPLVLELTVQCRTETNIPKVASKLSKPFTYTPDRRPGKISGAEILRAIKSLTDCEEYSSTDMKNVKYYKKRRCQLSETLKTEYNSMIKNKDVADTYTFDVKYMILSQILTKRLSESISPSFKGKIAKSFNTFFTVTFKTGPQKIKWSFLERKLKVLQPKVKKNKQISSALTPELSILDYLLPEEEDSSELRLLKPGCPLTKFIFSLALKELETLALNNFCKATVCYHRQVLRIHTNSITNSDFVEFFVNLFKEISGLEISTVIQESNTDSNILTPTLTCT